MRNALYGIGMGLCLLVAADCRAGAGARIMANPGTVYGTITEAVGAAVDGDVIQVATGVYFEAVLIVDKDISVMGGYDGAFKNRLTKPRTIVSASDSFTKRYAMRIAQSTVRLDRVDLRDGDVPVGESRSGGGLIVYDASHVTVVSANVYDNRCVGSGGGIDVGSGCALTMRDCAVYGNVADEPSQNFNAGGGIHGRAATVILERCRIYDNTVGGTFRSGGGLSMQGGSAELLATEVTGNQGTYWGGGIRVVDGGALTVSGDGSRVAGNTAVWGGGISAYDSMVLVSEGATVCSNRAGYDGGGLYLQSSTGIVEGASTRIGEPGSPNSGGGVFVDQSLLIVRRGATLGPNHSYVNGGNVLATNATCRFEGCAIGDTDEVSTAVNGGGIWASHSTLVLSNATLRACHADTLGGGIGAEQTIIVLTDNTMVGHPTTTTYANSAGTTNGTGCGGGIYMWGGWIFATNSTVLGNSSLDAGGGLWLRSGGLSLRQSTVSGNVAFGEGGGAWLQSVDVALDESFVLNNRSEHVAGGIYLSNGYANSFEAKRCELSGNAANTCGGLYVAGSGGVTLDSCGFSVNRSNMDGGALHVAHGALISCRDCLFENNRAGADGNTTGNGGAFYLFNSRLKLESVARSCGCYGNGANFGGAVYLSNGGLTLTATNGHELVCGENISTNDGGAIYALFTPQGVKSSGNVVFDGNRAGGDGGGIWLRGLTATQRGGAFKGNTARRGAAVRAEDGARVELADVLIRGNTAIDGAGLYAANQSTALVSNALFVRNTVDENGAAFSLKGADDAGELYSSTFADNGKGAIAFVPGAGVHVENCIVAGGLSNGATVSASCVIGGYPGAGNIGDDPTFIDAAGGNYRLHRGSPCIDTGHALAWNTNDLAGAARPCNDAWDMGAYEYDPATHDSDLDTMVDAWELDNGLDPDTDDGDENLDGDPATNLEEYHADTRANDRMHYFHIEELACDPGVRRLRTVTSARRVYTLQRRAALLGEDWQDVPGRVGLPGSATLGWLDDTNPPPQACYQVVVGTP